MGGWGSYNSSEDWLSYADTDEIIDLVENDDAFSENTEITCSRLSTIAWKYADLDIQIKAVRQLSRNLSRGTKFDYELLVDLWDHPNDSVANQAMESSLQCPPSKGRAYSVEMKLDAYENLTQILVACEILGDINASRNAEQMYSLVKNKEVDENISEAALDALCNFGDLRYFWKLNDLCKQPSSVVISNNLNLLLKNFYRVANKKKFGKEYGRIIVEILSSNDDLISDEIRLDSIEQIKQMGFKNKTLKKELVIQLKKLSKGNSELSKRAKLELGEKRFKIE